MVGGDDAYQAEVDEEFKSFLKQVLETGDLRGTAAEGITKFVIENGQAALSEKQKFVFDRDIIQKYQGSCDECGQTITWPEAYDFYHSPGRCGDCEARFEKFMSKD